MINNFEEAIPAFVATPETRQIAQPKELNNTKISGKESAPHHKIGLPLDSLFL